MGSAWLVFPIGTMPIRHSSLLLRGVEIRWKLTLRASKMFMLSWIPQAFLESLPLGLRRSSFLNSQVKEVSTETHC